MKRFSAGAVALGAALLFIAGPAHAELAALDLIRFMPQELDIVIGVDPGATAGTEFYKQVKARAGLAQLDQGIAAMEEVTGVNLLQDVQAIALGSYMGREGEGVVVVRGAWDRDYLVGLVGLNPSYSEKYVGDHVIHSWYDAEKQKIANAAFIRDDVLAISDQAPLLESVLAVVSGAKPAFAPAHDPAAATSAVAFAMASRPAQPGPDITANPVLNVLKTATVFVVPGASGVRLAATGTTLDPQMAPLVAQLTQGAAAMLQLQYAPDAAPWPVTVNANGGSVNATVDIPLDTAVAIVTEIINKKKAA